MARGITTLVSRADAAPADGNSFNPSISGNGAYVAFDSQATNLSTEDDDAVTDVFVRDRMNGVTTLISRGARPAPANGDSVDPSISSSGLKVAFTSDADNLRDDDDRRRLQRLPLRPALPVHGACEPHDRERHHQPAGRR